MSPAHKFKIAVGGCPNNCVKPDLNDLGIIGQMVPKLRRRGVQRLQEVRRGPGVPHGRGQAG